MPRILIMGIGAFAHSMMKILQENGADVECYLTRSYGHYGPSLCGKVWDVKKHPSPLEIIENRQVDFVLPMAVAWREQSWTEEFIRRKIPILSPIGKAMEIEILRQQAMLLCEKHGISVPSSFYVRNRLEALQLLQERPRAYVLKNPICSPFSPIHTIVCETVEDTLGWIERVDYAEGLFLQEYLGTTEASHFVFISGGQITSLGTNQEFKRAFTGEMGPIAGAPLAGIVEQDPEDRYGLARELILPLRPWFEQTQYCGPLQVSAIRKENKWYPIEYNVRLGVTTGALLLRMMKNPLATLMAVSQNQPAQPLWKNQFRYGVSLTLAGYGYPFVVPEVPRLPVQTLGPVDCDLWWNEVDLGENGVLYMADHKGMDQGHRIVDLNAFGETLSSATEQIYCNIQKIRCLGSYYRTDLAPEIWSLKSFS